MSLAIELTFYDAATGRITGRSFSAPEDALDNCPSGSLVIQGLWDTETHWIDGATPTPRPLASGFVLDGATMVFAMPVSALVTLTNEDGETLAATFAAERIDLGPGTYSWRIEPPFPYQRVAGEVTIP